MLQTDALESAILQELDRDGIYTLEELIKRLPSYSLNQVFSAVDRLNRDGTVALIHSVKFRYLLSLEPRHSPRRSTYAGLNSERAHDTHVLYNA